MKQWQKKTPESIENITYGAQTVTFFRGSWKIAGNLYMPKNIESGKKYPAIITVHSGKGIKGLYAKKMTEKDFIAIAFDTSYQVEDIRCAVYCLTTLPQIDVNTIIAIGICAGGGYVISVAHIEHRIKAIH